MSRFAAFDEAQDTVRDEAAYSPASGVVAETRTASEPEDGELEAKLSFEAAVAEEMRVDDAVAGGQAQARDQEVLELFPQLFGVGLFGWHGSLQRVDSWCSWVFHFLMTRATVGGRYKDHKRKHRWQGKLAATKTGTGVPCPCARLGLNKDRTEGANSGTRRISGRKGD